MAGAFDTAKKGFDAQSARFAQILWNGIVIGGLQNVQWREHTGVRDYIGEIGSDHKEPDFDQRMVRGSIEKLTLNKRKIRDLFANGDSSNLDIDFRDYQFTIVAVYQGVYPNPDGSNAPAPGNMAGPYNEIINNVMFQELGTRVGGPYELIREDVTFIGTSQGAVAATETGVGR